MNVKVGLIGVFDMLKFKNLRKNRAEMIASAEAKPLPGTYRVNELAKRLHPAAQYLKIAEIVQETHDAKSFVLVPDEEAGTRGLAPFKAGSYINVRSPAPLPGAPTPSPPARRRRLRANTASP